MKRYNPKEIEPKWQAKWETDKIYQAGEDREKPKKYVLEYFPYPSGAAMHVGHVRNYTIGDAIARFDRMNGYNVLHPMGWDAFGLPAENYAIKHKISPRKAIDENTDRFRKQLMQMGFSYDWSREIDSTDPKYYKWTQWFFLLLLKKGLAYQKEALVNWDPVDKTVLANEQIIDGKAERSGAVVEKKSLKQWFFKITDYADRLLYDLDDLDWSESIKTMQRNWIGRSQGAEITFPISQGDEEKPNFVILHGYKGSADGNFIPWLKKSLEKQGFKVQAPQLPNSDNPKESEQVGYVLQNCTINENTVLIGHSLGAAVAMKIVEQLDQPIRRLALVAPTLEPKFGSKPREFWKHFNLTYKYEAIVERARSITVLSDTGELERRGAYVKYLGEKLNSIPYEVGAEKKHFLGKTELTILQMLQPSIDVFTTRHDTQYGVTFLVLAPEHPLVPTITTAEHKKAVDDYIEQASRKSELERQSEGDKEKSGVFTGAYAINPANDEKIPIWIADYVLMGYGTGAVMGVPAHDDRDHVFAKKYGLEIRQVLKTDKDSDFHSEGVVINSDKYDGMRSEAMREEILADFVKAGVAKEVVNYKIRDWLISRQRYWGAPIPIIHCPKCGTVPVPEDQLPVVLPEVKSYEPSGDGRSPLANVPEFVNTTCPKCGGKAERETDTMDGFACSSWYFLRFADPHNDKEAFAKDKAKFWLPVDDYIGGAEHAVMHLLYARFWTKVMHDDGLIDFKEPFTTLRNQGMILAPDGAKMSKSKGNTIEPDAIIDQGYGADSIRLMELFIGPWNQAVNWSVTGVAGTNRFLQRTWVLAQEFMEAEAGEAGESVGIRRAVHKATKKVSQDLRSLSFNTAIAAQMELVNDLYRVKAGDAYASKDWRRAIETLLQLLAPFAPHIAEELWYQLGHDGSIHTSEWPAWDEKYLSEDTITIAVQVNGKLRGQVSVSGDASEDAVINAAKSDGKVAAHITGKELRKTIYVPGKLVNFVV
jgi:leucyl-tRNA synthetase